MLRNTKIKYKLFFTPLLALSFIVLSYAANRYIVAENELLVRDIEEQYYPELEKFRELESLLRTIAREFQDAATLEDPSILEDLEQLREQFLSKAEEGMRDGGAGETARLFDLYYTQARAITLLIQEGNIFGAEYTDSQEKMSRRFVEVEQFIAGKRSLAQEKIGEAFLLTRGNLKTFGSQIFWMTLISVLVITLLTLLLSREITIPLDQVVNALRVFSKERQQSALTVYRNDELGELTTAFNQLIADLLSTTVSKNAVESVFKAIKEALIQVDSKGRIQMVNAATTDLLGYEENELLGKSIRLVIPDIDAADDNGLFAFMEAGAVANRETTYRTKDHLEVVMSLSAAPIFDEGAVKGLVLSARDLRETMKLIRDLQALTQEQELTSWMKSKVTHIVGSLQASRTLSGFATDLATEIGRLFNVGFGAVFISEAGAEESILRLKGGYALPGDGSMPQKFAPGEGLVGQAALEKRTIFQDTVPGEYRSIIPGIEEASPCHLLFQPVLYDREVKAVLQLASFEKFSRQQLDLLDQLSELLGILIDNTLKRDRTEKLLTESQIMAETLQSQSEELQETNEQLEEQANALISAEEVTRKRNEELLAAQQELTLRADQLAQSNKYKSDFLANMSHELRTPLNSILILSKLLIEGHSGEERKMATTIHDAGGELLKLIDDILDLAKIEAGKMRMELQVFRLGDLLHDLEAMIEPLAGEKGLAFSIHTAPGLPENLEQDRERLQQILVNLLSNAIKFTEQGSVHLEIKPSKELESGLAFAVVDTGIGIPKEKQDLIFEAFQQAEGSTNRIYGGTGLGLSISRNIAERLGGKLVLESIVGEGSTFTLHLPARSPFSSEEPEPMLEPVVLPERKPVTANEIQPGEKGLLIIGDSACGAAFQEIGRARGYAPYVSDPTASGVDTVRQKKPAAIVLDMDFSNSWSLLNALKSHPETRHIPVLVTAGENVQDRAHKMGVTTFLLKPLDEEALEAAFNELIHLGSKSKKLLIVEDDAKEREAIRQLMSKETHAITTVGTGGEALAELANGTFSCMILDLKLDDISGYEVLQRMEENRTMATPPTIVYTGMSLSQEDERRLQAFAETIMIKTVTSPSLLKETVSDFLNGKNVGGKTSLQNPKLGRLPQGKTVLVVDDNWRNIYSLVAVLEREGVDVIAAGNGREAVETLSGDNKIDLVLMDIMMPVMDGYEAIGRIREMDRYKDLPIIALTAKAMKKDREKCIQVGASDYLSKPVDQDRLFSLIKIWLTNQ
ncbi:MAG: response regulator [Acidobacteriota bacterium]|nr:response regulator [Acidobacteriota bacterium]